MMQVMPFWKNEIGRPGDNLIDTRTNLRYGCTILRYYLDKEKGRLAMHWQDITAVTASTGMPNWCWMPGQKNWR